MIINFLGHLHPVFVHLPIGFLVLAYLVQYLAKSHAGKPLLMDFILFAGVFSSIAAAFLDGCYPCPAGTKKNYWTGTGTLQYWFAFFQFSCSSTSAIKKMLTQRPSTILVFM